MFGACVEQLNGRAKETSRTGDKRIQPLRRNFQDHRLSANHKVNLHFLNMT
jgi:hypothetical protein